MRKFYAPLLEAKYDHAEPRLRDLEQLELIASRYRSRPRMLLEMTLDPPSSTQDLAGPPQLDDDYLVLSTIHSAKGLEWDAVYVIHAADGNIPSDMATKQRRGNRGGAAAVLRRPDAGEELALRLLSAALLLARPQRPSQLFAADPLPARLAVAVLRAMRQRAGRRPRTIWTRFPAALPTATSAAARRTCGPNQRLIAFAWLSRSCMMLRAFFRCSW